MLLACRTRGDPHRFLNGSGVVNLSAFDHGGEVAGVANVLRWVAMQG